MKTITLKIDDRVNEQFMTLLRSFSDHELRILEQKVIVSSFVGVTLIALTFPHIADWWQMGHNSITELSPEETAEDGGKKGGFLNKLKALQKKQEEEANSSQPEGKKATIGEQLEKSVDNIDKYNSDLNKAKATDLSDGKKIELETEKK